MTADDLPTPRKPADAYPLVAELLGNGWFTTPAPEAGMEIVVEGLDRVHTTWHVAYEESIPLKVLVANHAHLRLVSSRPFAPTPTRENP